MAAEDDDLSRRLRALRGEAAEPTTDEELLERVRKLKGGASAPPPSRGDLLLPPAARDEVKELLGAYGDHARLASGLGAGSSSLGSVAMLPPKQMSEAEEVEELLSMKADELRMANPAAGGAASCAVGASRGTSEPPLDAPRRADFDALKREATRVLNDARKQMPLAVHEAHDEDDVDDEAEEAAALLEQLQEELALEERVRANEGPPKKLVPAPESLPSAGVQFPSVPTQVAFNSETKGKQNVMKSSSSKVEDDMSYWCVICNDDAVVWCSGCDNDPYCQRCFREGHSEPDLRDHVTVRIRR
ncbi:hypothetical protein AB1Y20_004357 [Prymnesium parvum]|uniref:Abscission/NoCut checkpoint regulator n=1 Tax=Prymnesium parvum TaxID=97485 RepID=A0AB34IWB4_PRYPA